MNTTEELLREISRLVTRMESLVSASKQHNKYGSVMDGIDLDKDDPDDILRFDMLAVSMEKLEDIIHSVRHLEREIIYEGFLSKDENGRYESNGYVYTSGDSIEVLVYDEYFEADKWVSSRVEHNGNGYYVHGYSDVKMDGMKVRVRSRR